MSKRNQILLFFGFCFLLFGQSVDALTIGHTEDKTKVCFNRTTGEYGGSYLASTGDSCSSGYGTDSIKFIGDQYAYCVEWKLSVCSVNYELDTDWNSKSKSAITAGIVMDLMEQKYTDTNQRYEMVGAALNTYFYKKVNKSTSYDFYSSNDVVKSVYDQATTYGNAISLSTSLPSLSFSVSSKVLNLLNASNNTFISDKITLSGLQVAYGGSTAEYGKANISYALTASTTTGTVQFCSTSRGTGCSNTLDLTGKSGSYSFYLKAMGVTSADTIKINIKGSNSSTYPTVVRYVNSDCGTSSQRLGVKDSVTINRSVSQTLQLVVPDLVNHRIVAYKYNEHGESLEGATLELYRDDYEDSSNLLKKNDGNSSSVSYTTEKVETTQDDFYNHDYFLIERYAPDGYVLGSQVNHIYSKETGSSSKTMCYYNGGNESADSEEVDAERCNFSAYEYKCQSSVDAADIKDLSEQGNCEFNLDVPEDDVEIINPGVGESGTDIDSGDSTGDGDSTDTGAGEDNTGESDSTTEGEEETPEEAVVTYQKVCYNVDKNEVVDDETFCSDKDKYVKVTKSSGNIVVSQVNKKNIIRISKRDITSSEELSGAKLKICAEVDYEDNGLDCTPAKTIDDVEMYWVSTTQAREFNGIPKGNYYIIEITPPKGYIKATTAIAFSIDEKGEVTTDDKVITNDQFIKDQEAIVVNNEINSLYISKQDIVTSKELPGATISICRTYRDANGEYQLIMDQYDNECIPAALANGEDAIWVSTSEPKKIEGLAAGTYYLVEKIAPTDYSTAESILFTLKDDGTLVDKDGVALSDKKIVMSDDPIENKPTGEFSHYVVIALFAVAVCLGLGSYYYLRTTRTVLTNHNELDIKKVRKRKIHKK